MQRELFMNSVEAVGDHPIVIVAAGTGGHVFPALAVAKELALRGVRILWIGTPTGFEVSVVKDAGFTFESISVSGLRGKGLKGLLSAPFKVLKATVQSLMLLTKYKPRLMLSMGGYVTGPAGIAAKLCGVKLVIHEQNAIAGLTNQLLAPLSHAVFSGFPNALQKYKSFRCIGNPLRAPLIEAAQSVRKDKEQVNPDLEEITKVIRPLKLLVLGGSLGARTLNHWVPDALAQIEAQVRPEVWHQTGRQGVEDAKANYGRAQMDVRVEPFIEDMQAAYTWADLVICRAGAMTSSEVLAMALPAIFVPYPYAVDDHQRANAQSLVTLGAARLLVEQDGDADQLKEMLVGLIKNPKGLAQMREAALNDTTLGATQVLTDYLVSEIDEC